MCPHSSSEAEYTSAFGASSTSSVSTLPFGSKVQPSSALKSFLPSDSKFLQRIVRGSKALTCFVSLSPSRNRPSGIVDRALVREREGFAEREIGVFAAD